MGYYPPYISDNYLTTFRYIPTQRAYQTIKKVDALETKSYTKKTISQRSLEKNRFKGEYVDYFG